MKGQRKGTYPCLGGGLGGLLSGGDISAESLRLTRNSQVGSGGSSVGICRGVRKQGSLRKGQNHDQKAGWDFVGRR